MVIRPLKPNEMTELFNQRIFLEDIVWRALANFPKLFSSRNDSRNDGRHNRIRISHGMRVSRATIPFVAQRSASTAASPVKLR